MQGAPKRLCFGSCAWASVGSTSGSLIRRAPSVLPNNAILNVRHLTTYRYKRPIRLGEHRMMMRPRDGHDQRLVTWDLSLEPKPVRLRWLYDALDNCVALASFSGSDDRARCREPLHRRALGRRFPRRRDRSARPQLSFLLSAGRAAGRHARDRASLSRPRRRPRTMGPPVRGRGRRDADQPPPHDDDLRHQGEPSPTSAGKSPAFSRPGERSTGGAEVAGTSRS